MNKLWIAGALACLSAVAVAQSAPSKDNGPVQGQAANPPDAASGQTAGKRMHKPVSMSTNGGKTANDDWTSSAKSNDPKTGKGQAGVAAGDVNGDGVPDATAKNSAHATESITPAATATGAAQPRDAATGQASGKRQHEPVTTTKPVATKPMQK